MKFYINTIIAMSQDFSYLFKEMYLPEMFSNSDKFILKQLRELLALFHQLHEPMMRSFWEEKGQNIISDSSKRL